MYSKEPNKKYKISNVGRTNNYSYKKKQIIRIYIPQYAQINKIKRAVFIHYILMLNYEMSLN